MIINNLYDGFNEMVLNVWPILKEASDRGIPIDSQERDKLVTDLEKDRTDLYKKIQDTVIDEIKGLHPKEGYKKTPPLVKQLALEYEALEARLSSQGKKVVDFDTFVLKKSYQLLTNVVKNAPEFLWAKLRLATFEDIDKNTGETTESNRWVWVKDFNPNYYKQIIAYMKWKGHKVPVKITGQETTDAKELERLAISTKDLFYDEVIEYRQINKMLTNDLPNWNPKKETGAVHTEFGFYPATGQLNSRNPNVQNANKHKPLGKRFRRIIRARSYRDGRWAGRRRRIVELDYSGFHAIMLGREAESARYINISRADAHSWLTSYIVGKPVEYPRDYNTNSGAVKTFRERLKQIKSDYKIIRDTQSKPTILGIGLGLGARKMYWMNREKWDKKSGQMVGIKSEAHSKKYKGIVQELLPELFSYQERQKDKAYHQTYLINAWGMIRWFFDVRGEDGEAAIAFDVQGNAHGMLRWVLRRLESLVYEGLDRQAYYLSRCDVGLDNYINALDRFNFINTIHDSLVFEPWEDEVELCIRTVKRVMETACKRLANKVCPNGLIVGAEATVGENWAEWHEKDNPLGMKEYKLTA